MDFVNKFCTDNFDLDNYVKLIEIRENHYPTEDDQYVYGEVIYWNRQFFYAETESFEHF